MALELSSAFRIDFKWFSACLLFWLDSDKWMTWALISGLVLGAACSCGDALLPSLMGILLFPRCTGFLDTHLGRTVKWPDLKSKWREAKEAHEWLPLLIFLRVWNPCTLLSHWKWMPVFWKFAWRLEDFFSKINLEKVKVKMIKCFWPVYTMKVDWLGIQGNK